jgi:hypothetical protein
VELVAVEGAGHNDLQEFALYRQALARRLQAAAAAGRPRTPP